MRAILRKKVIEEELLKKNMQQQDFATEIGVDSSYISLLLNGKHSPKPSLRESIESVFPDKEWDDLFEIVD